MSYLAFLCARDVDRDRDEKRHAMPDAGLRVEGLKKQHYQPMRMGLDADGRFHILRGSESGVAVMMFS